MDGEHSLSPARKDIRAAVAIAILALVCLLIWKVHEKHPPGGRRGAPAGSSEQYFAGRDLIARRTLRLRSELPGVRLFILIPRPKRIHDTVTELWANQGARWRRIQRRSDLHGLVQIRTAAEALEHVRFGTTYPSHSYFVLSDDDGFMEVEGTDELPETPTFGLADSYTKVGAALNPPPFGTLGVNGVIGAQDFRVGGFTPPKVDKVCGGFTVARWMTVPDPAWKPGNWQRSLKAEPWNPDGFFVGQVREFVGTDGEMRRRLLGRKPAPRLPHTTWQGVHIAL